MPESIDKSDNVELTDDDLENNSKGQLIKLAGQLRDRRNE
ncbi:phosphoserine phosphatase, partial [Halobacteriales archaeon QS_7_69_60]